MIVQSNVMAGKRGLIVGVANDRSIAWGITRAVALNGAEVALTYQGEALEKRVRPLAAEVGATLVAPCDVTDDDNMKALFDTIAEKWGRLDFLVHAVAYSDKNQLKGKYVDTTLDNFLRTMQISAFSLVQMAQYARPLMQHGGSILTLSYLGAERVIPHYNVMGVAKAALESSVQYLAADLGPENIRVNAISAGPIKTLAASGIGDFRYIMRWNEMNSPLRRTVSIEEVGNASLLMLSDMGTGITGEVMHVDAGYHIVGMKAEDAPDINLS
ncbi:enoyl-ACP reductase FabI [Tistrella sp.]|uniref:enoyl-ACP reductase FabI n=1 Tax=Tistrella sp. TaxID=2024861 RepID=UPI000C98E088|nr:enoyl-ACP reductase FabI [Tistrella sp.]MAD38274.1 enoyl-[acyl-carrier-protein] reductase FabI [Tistrella sp.]|tara:strand:- start:420 stop:1232 length:813 start_codon:yes stop_codon:yes gene_type:complete